MTTPNQDNLPPIGLLSALKDGLRALWDKLGLSIGLSLTWSLLLYIAINAAHAIRLGHGALVNGIFAALLITFLLAPASAGLFAVVWRVAAREETEYFDFWRAARKLYAPSLALGFLNAAVVGTLALSVWFYAHLRGVLPLAFAFLSIDALILWAAMAIYHFPLLVAQEAGVFDTPEHRAKRGTFAILRRAFFLALGKPGFTLGLLLATLLISTPVLLLNGLNVILWPGLVAFLTSSGTRTLLMLYDVIPVPTIEVVVPDEKFRMRLDEK